jgi:hypothetical protein
MQGNMETAMKHWLNMKKGYQLEGMIKQNYMKIACSACLSNEW